MKHGTKKLFHISIKSGSRIGVVYPRCALKATKYAERNKDINWDTFYVHGFKYSVLLKWQLFSTIAIYTQCNCYKNLSNF